MWSFYGLLDHELAEVIEFYPDRLTAEAELAAILADEPGWAHKLQVVGVDFAGSESEVFAAEDRRQP